MAYIWCIGGGLMQVPVVEEIKKMGYMSIVSDGNKDCPCKNKADIFIHKDIFDIDGHLEESLGMEDTLVGVVAIGIDAPVTAARLAEKFGLPACETSTAELIQNKYTLRKLQKFFGFHHPKFEHVEGQWGINRIDKDLIIKPVLNSGSRGVTILKAGSTPMEAMRAVEKARLASRDKCALVEERLYGTEHTVETLVDRHGVCHPCFITDRIFDYSNAALEKGLRHPSVLPRYVQASAYRLASSMAKAFMLESTPLKLDIMVTENGIVAIEATTRMSGGFDCQYLVPAATGKNLIRAGIEVALGNDIPLECLDIKKNKVAVSNSLWPPEGIIKSITGVKEASKLEGVVKIIMSRKEGDFIEPYTDCAKRVCFVITVGNTYGEAMGVFEEVKNIIKIEVKQ